MSAAQVEKTIQQKKQLVKQAASFVFIPSAKLA
jgi:hypothetical protein